MFRNLICRLTDHRYGYHPQDPPWCLRCLSDEYYPDRSTLGGWFGRIRYAVRVRWQRLGLRPCKHCGERFGRHGEDCIPF